MCPWVDLLNSVHHIKILPLTSQTLEWLPSKDGMVERSIHKEKLNRFNDVPDHLCVCCQTSKKILVEMRSVTALHLEM